MNVRMRRDFTTRVSDGWKERTVPHSIADCGLRIVDCGLWIADCGLRKRTVCVPASSHVRSYGASHEGAHQAAAQLVGDLALVERMGLELHADGGGAVGERFDADDLERLLDERAPHRVALHRRA